MRQPSDFLPGTDLHRLISEAVASRIQLSRNAMSRRYAQWTRNEELFNAYIPEKTNDAIRKAEKRTSGEPSYVTIEVPYTYAIALTAHTYYTSVFLSRSPVFQFTGRHGEAETKIIAVEAVMDYQLQVGGNMMPLFIWLLDPLKYGIGFVGHYWDEELVPITRKVAEQPTLGGIPIPFSRPRERYVTELTRGYVGNRIFNIRPQDAFPDPRVSIWNFQAGEFFARYTEIPSQELLAGVRTGRYFNVAAALAAQKAGSSGEYRDPGSVRAGELPGDETLVSSNLSMGTSILKAHEMYLRLVPSEWGLSDSTYQEIWVITCTPEKIIIGCQPLGDASNRFPIDVIEHEPNGYTFFSRSMMEIAEPLNNVMTWLINSHFYNVRSALNNQFVYDPSMIEEADINRPGPGHRLRLTPNAMGRGVDAAIKQLPVADVTRGHVQDMYMVGELIQRIFGVTDNVMGLVNPGGRKTATEIRTSTSLAVNRLKTQCEIMSSMGFAPLAQKLLQRTQANHTFERTYRVVGDLVNFGNPFTVVDAEQLAGFYDFIPVDGSMPIDRFAQATLWQNLMATAAQIPAVAMQYDFGKVFAWVATLAGAKNVQQFKLNIVPDQQVLAAASAGNVVPIRQSALTSSGVPEPGQQPGMGQTL